MSKVILWHRADGGVSFTDPSALCNPPLEGESEQQYLDRVALEALSVGAVPSGAVRGQNTEKAALPDKRWRNAWRHSGGNVAIDLPAARGLRRAELLLAREQALAALPRQIEEATARGKHARAAALRGKLTSALLADAAALDAELASVPSLAALDTYVPPALADEPEMVDAATDALAAPAAHAAVWEGTVTTKRPAAVPGVRVRDGLVGRFLASGRGASGGQLPHLKPGDRHALAGETLVLEVSRDGEVWVRAEGAGSWRVALDLFAC